MSEYNDALTTAWLAFRFYLSEISRHERDARQHKANPQPHTQNSEGYISLSRYRAAKWLVKFIRLAREADGFVYIDRHVYVEQGLLFA